MEPSRGNAELVGAVRLDKADSPGFHQKKVVVPLMIFHLYDMGRANFGKIYDPKELSFLLDKSFERMIFFGGDKDSPTQ